MILKRVGCERSRNDGAAQTSRLYRGIWRALEERKPALWELR
jgi:hypothetical protein